MQVLQQRSRIGVFTQKAQGELLSEKSLFSASGLTRSLQSLFSPQLGGLGRNSSTRHSSIVNWSPSLMFFKGSTFML